MTKIAELKKKLMTNPEFRQEYEKADAEFQLVEALISGNKWQLFGSSFLPRGRLEFRQFGPF